MSHDNIDESAAIDLDDHDQDEHELQEIADMDDEFGQWVLAAS